MSNDKEIRIRAVLDASTFDKGVGEIQEKLKKLTQQQTQGVGTTKQLGKDSVLGKYAQQAFGDFSKDSQKQLETMYQSQRREAVNQSITMKGKEAELAKMAKMDGEMTKQQKERLENLKKEIELLKEKHRLTLNTAAETQKAIDKMKPAEPAGDTGNQPPPPPSDPQSKFKNVLGGMMKQFGVAAIIGGVVNGTATMIEDSITRERKIKMNNAATMNMGSREMREGMQGQGSRGMFWMPERARAMRSAAEEQGSQSTMDKVKAWGGSALQVGGLATSIATGWTGIGLGVGVGMMGAGTALKGGVIGDEKSRAAMFDREKFRSMQTKEGMEKYEQNLAAEKARDPRRQLARDYFEEQSGNMASTQKLMGLGTDRELMAGDNVGVLQRNMKYGNQFGGVNFSQQTIQEQAQALASGGAMTEGIRDMSGQAATYNRQFNLSNAGQTMGRMQGNTGMNSSLTDMAYQKLLAEAVRLGVDTSTMPRELEKMTQMTAELSTAGGVNATGMTDLFGAGVADLNQKALGAAAGAAQTFQNTAKEAGGWEGQMGMGFLQGGKAQELLGGKQLNAKQMNYLNQQSASELDEAGFARVGAYLDIEPEKAKQLLQEKDKYKQGRTGEEDKAYQNLGDFIKGKSPEEAKAAINTTAGSKLYEEARATRGQTHGDFMQKDQATQMAELLMESRTAVGDQGAMPLAAAEEKVAGQKGKKETRAAYVEEGAVATGDMARMDALNENLDGFKKAAEGYTKAAVEYNKQFDLMVAATKMGAEKMTDVAKSLEDLDHRISSGSFGDGVPSSKPPGAR